MEPGEGHPDDKARGGGGVGGDKGVGGIAPGGQGGAGVEAEPAKPEKRSTEDDHRHVMGDVDAAAFADDERSGEGGRCASRFRVSQF